MRNVQNISGWLGAIATIAVVSATIPAISGKTAAQRDNAVWAEAVAEFQAFDTATIDFDIIHFIIQVSYISITCYGIGAGFGRLTSFLDRI